MTGAHEAIKAIVTEIMFDNVYDKYVSFSDIEKFIIPYNFRMVGIDLTNNNLFSDDYGIDQKGNNKSNESLDAKPPEEWCRFS